MHFEQICLKNWQVGEVLSQVGDARIAKVKELDAARVIIVQHQVVEPEVSVHDSGHFMEIQNLRAGSDNGWSCMGNVSYGGD